MSEIAQLFESALRNNRATLLRQAAMRTLERMPANTTIRELMQSEAAAALRELTLDDLADGLASTATSSTGAGHDRGARRLRIEPGQHAETSLSAVEQGASREETLYRDILDALSGNPLTIGQLAKQLSLDTDEVRGYLAWMKKMGKVSSSGRARATRYQAC